MSYAVPPKAFQKTMVFIDGTNLFYRLESAKVHLKSLKSLAISASGGREIIRVYVYTTEYHLVKAREFHSPGLTDGVQVVLGDEIPMKGGTPKEKGVDALLVADLIYHAAQRNYDQAILVSVDTDFVHVIKRVQDFGCKTAVMGICASVPQRLKNVADEVFEQDGSVLYSRGIAEK
jgi:uncharacterized LabA/DUF88 family protein